MKISLAVRSHYAKLGRKGGKARNKRLSAQRRQQIARNAARERWRRVAQVTALSTDETPTWTFTEIFVDTHLIRKYFACVVPSAPRAIGAPPHVAKRTRIEIRTLTGKSNYVSPQKAEQLFQEKRIIWTDDAHLYATMSIPTGFGDYSNVLTNRSILTVRQSGYAGPLVVQLL